MIPFTLMGLRALKSMVKVAKDAIKRKQGLIFSKVAERNS